MSLKTQHKVIAQETEPGGPRASRRAQSQRSRCHTSPLGLNVLPSGVLSFPRRHPARTGGSPAPAPSFALRAPPRGAEEHRGPDSTHTPPVSPTRCQRRRARRRDAADVVSAASCLRVPGHHHQREAPASEGWAANASARTPRPGRRAASRSGSGGRRGLGPAGGRAGQDVGQEAAASTGRHRPGHGLGGVAARATCQCSQDEDRGGTASLRPPTPVTTPGSPAVPATGRPPVRISCRC